jgi:hypothetical protein
MQPAGDAGAATLRKGESMAGNADFPWDKFDPVAYLTHNYHRLRKDDTALLEEMREYFTTTLEGNTYECVDVGAGTNLYPALAMLPWAKKITMVEHSAANIDWLKREVTSYSDSWDQYWELLRGEPPYRAVTDPRAGLKARAVVEKKSIFELPKQRWDLGTMFFVAESISPRQEEFEHAVSCFTGSLRPGAPFFAAFMERSQGYEVGQGWFPAFSVGASDIHDCFASSTAELVVRRLSIDIDDDPLRDGYTGMVLAHGRLTRA